MQLKRVWLWPNIGKAVAVILASSVLSGTITVLLSLDHFWAIFVGGLLGVPTGWFVGASWPYTRFVCVSTEQPQ